MAIRSPHIRGKLRQRKPAKPAREYVIQLNTVDVRMTIVFADTLPVIHEHASDRSASSSRPGAIFCFYKPLGLSFARR
jgi:hypothetical protein